MEQYIEDLFCHKYRSSMPRLRISAHFFPKTGRRMNKPGEQMMCSFRLNKQIEDGQRYIFKCTHPKFIPIQIILFEAISELADWNTHIDVSQHKISYLNYYLIIKILSASQRISELFYTLLETYCNIAQSLVSYSCLTSITYFTMY